MNLINMNKQTNYAQWKFTSTLFIPHISNITKKNMRLWREKINLASTKNNNKLWKRELKYSEICLNLTSLGPTFVFGMDSCSVYTG